MIKEQFLSQSCPTLRQRRQKILISKKLKDCVLNGWPDDRRKVGITVRPYYNFRDEITVYEDVLLKGNRIIVPLSHRNVKTCKAHALLARYDH